MNSPIICVCLAISSVIILLSAYTASFIEEFYTIQPIIITTNKKFKEKAQLKQYDPNRSPLFKSFKIRYNQLFPTSAENELIKLQDGTYVSKIEYQQQEGQFSQIQNDFQEIEDQKFFSNIIRNKTFNHMFEMKEKDSEHLYMINQNNDVETGLQYNPYYGQINLMRVPLKPYMKNKDINQRRETKQYKEEKQQLVNQLNAKQIQICKQFYIPGVITHITLNQNKNDKMLVGYRILNEEGYIHRIRIYHELSCEEPLHANRSIIEQGQREFERTLNNDSLYKIKNSPQNPIYDGSIEDFALDGTSSITSINFNQDSITYSRGYDYYQFRILKKSETDGKWKKTSNGPIINRKVDKVFICTGLSYVDMGGQIPYLVVVSLKGQTYTEMKVIVEFFMNQVEKDVGSESWVLKKQIYKREFPIFQTPLIYNGEINQFITYFTNNDPKNQILGLFGQFFIALDWSETAKNILVFETFRENNEKIEVIASTQDNTHILLYSGDQNQMTQVYRDKATFDQEQVIEDWLEVRLQSLPFELQNKRILSLYIKLTQQGERIIVILFENGYLVSMKLDEQRDDYLGSLFMPEDDMLVDLLIPSIVAITATIVLIFRRRTTLNQNQQRHNSLLRQMDQGRFRAQFQRHENRAQARLQQQVQLAGDEQPINPPQDNQQEQVNQQNQVVGDIIGLNEDDLEFREEQ